MTDIQRERIQELLKIVKQNEERHDNLKWGALIATVLIILGVMAAYLAYLSSVFVE